jgi:hypothetical protein
MWPDTWITPLGGILTLQFVAIALILVVVVNWRWGHKRKAMMALGCACVVELVASAVAYTKL